MRTPVLEWAHAPTLRAQLDELGLPAELRRQISFRNTHLPNPERGPTYIHYPPPWEGCCTPPGIGSARLWGDFCINEWNTLAPWALGPDMSPGWALTLDGIAARLRSAGEGSRTLWAFDLLHPGQWLSHPRPAFLVSDLVQWGPPLPAELIADVDQALSAPPDPGDRWGRFKNEANSETTYHGVRCYETTWMWGV